MIVARQMQQAMKHQNLDLRCQGMATLNSLPARGRDADGEVSHDFARPGHGVVGRERQDIRRLIHSAKLTVEPPHGFVGGE